MKYTAPQQIKRAILLHFIQNWKNDYPEEARDIEITPENVDELYDSREDGPFGEYIDNLQDAENDLRSSGLETGLKARQHSRHFESDEVAARMDDGSWVAWTYWHGGGKHGMPSEIEWIDDAYYVQCREVMKPVFEFSLITE